MNWPIFLVGIAAGWIIEWVIDLLFWRKRQKQWVATESGYRAQFAEVTAELEDQKAQAAQVKTVEAGLVTAQAEVGALRDQLAAAEAERDRLDAKSTDVDALRDQLAAAEAECDRLAAELTGVDALRDQLATAEAERDRLEAKVASMEAQQQTLAHHLGRLAGVAVAAPAAAGAALVAMSRGEHVDLKALSQGAGDDLTMIEGVGPKIQELLYQNGIHTYAELADCDDERLKVILAGGGAAFRLADPSTWPRQARLAAAHDWARLQTLKQQLTGGIKRPAAEKAPPPDDLTMLEGVGPKIQELLYQNGIHTFAELADCDVERLKAILAGGGAAFRLANPSTWPQQARLAAAQDWPRLQALNEQLAGGVRRARQPAREDDLTIIEGIGPSISDSLKKHGIRTFAQLARTGVEQLQAILAEGGPAFKLAAPAVASWPQQARLAAEGAWDQLHALKDTLKAGRGDTGEPGPEVGPGEAD